MGRNSFLLMDKSWPRARRCAPAFLLTADLRSALKCPSLLITGPKLKRSCVETACGGVEVG